MHLLSPSANELGAVSVSPTPVSVTPISTALQATRLDTPVETSPKAENRGIQPQQRNQQTAPREVTTSDDPCAANITAPLVLDTAEVHSNVPPIMNLNPVNANHEENGSAMEEGGESNPAWYDIRPPGSPRDNPSEDWGQHSDSFNNLGFEDNSWNEPSFEEHQPAKIQRTQFGGRPRGDSHRQWINSNRNGDRNLHGKRQWYPKEAQAKQPNQQIDVKEPVNFPTANYIRQRPDGTDEWYIPQGLPVKTWSRSIPFHYRVIQRQKDLSIAVYDPPTRKERMQGNWSDVSASTKEPVKDPEVLPPLIIVRNESLINTGATQSQHKLPLIGDKLFVRKITIRPGRIVQELNMPITTYEERGLVQASANGCNVSIAARRFRMQTVAMSVVAVSTEQGEPRIRICGRHRLQTIVVAPYNVPAECHDLQRGEKIEVKMYSPQVNSHMAIHENYCLPPNSPMASDEKKTTSNIKFIAGIARWNVQENGIDTFTHPFANLTQLDLEKIRHYENFMLSAAARAHEQKVSEMRRAAHTGKLTPVDNGEVQFVTDRCFNDDDWAIRSKLWKDDAIVMISPAKGENANQPVGIAQLTTVEADEDERTFTIQLRAEPLGSGDRDIEPDSTLGQIVQGKLEARISFSEGNTQFKRLMDVHQQCSITSAFKNRYPAQHPLAVMLGISHLLEPPKLKEAELKADNSDLNEEQLQSLLCTLRGQPLTFTGASAGTAPSNNATTNIVKAFVKCTNPAADEFLVIQSNAYNRSHAGKMETCFEESRLLATVKRVYAEQEASMEEPEKEAMLDYISRSESGMAFHVPDGKALTFVIKHRKPRVIFCTLGMLHRCHGKLAPFVTGVAVDEAAVLSEQEMTTMMAMLPNVSTVSFVGDSKQAKSHDFDVPDGVREYGLFPVTDVVQARGIPKIDLKYTYRFGKAFLEKLVSPACYDGVLQCGADDERHQKFFDLRFNGISPRLPAVVFNTDARDVRNLAKSRHNEKQRNGAIRMAESIQKQQADAQIAILTYYAAEAEACQEALEQRRLKGIEAFTVDKFQGRETDYALVLLSRAHNEEEDFDPAKFKFVLDPNRATVAVTRCRQGMFIFGQVSLLKRNVVWNRFLSALQPHSSVLELENLADLLDVQVK